MVALRTFFLVLSVLVCSGCVASRQLIIEKPDFVHSKTSPQKELVKLYTDVAMGTTVAQMASLGFPMERCLNDAEANVKCNQGIVALKRAFGENIFGNLFGGVNSFQNIDSIVQELAENIDTYLLVTVRFKELQTKTLTIFYFIYTRERKETKGYNTEYRYLFRNNVLIYKDRGQSTEGPVDETQRKSEWGVDPKLFIDGFKLLK